MNGLVMEGGAMRGLFTAGVIDVLMENGIKFDGAVGVSAGAAFGANYKSNQIGRVIRYNKNFCKNWRYRSYRSLIFTGDLYGAKFCYHEMPEKLDYFDIEEFQKNPMDFYVVTTDLNTGKPHYYLLSDGKYNDLEWIRASASMPLASRKVKLEGLTLLDGGITDSIPLKFMEDKGYDKNLVILTQPIDYVKGSYKKLMPIIKLAYHKYPNMIKAIAERHEMYNAQTVYVKEQEDSGKCFVIRPPHPLGVGSLERNPDKMQEVYDIGRAEATKHIDEIKKYLDK